MSRGNKEVVYTYAVVDDNTPIQKLGILDQIRVMLMELTKDKSADLNKWDAVAVEKNTLKSDLYDFIENATRPVMKGKCIGVRFKIHSDFGVVLEEVLRSPRFFNYYEISITEPRMKYGSAFYYIVKMVVK